MCSSKITKATTVCMHRITRSMVYGGVRALNVHACDERMHGTGGRTKSKLDRPNFATSGGGRVVKILIIFDVNCSTSSRCPPCRRMDRTCFPGQRDSFECLPWGDTTGRAAGVAVGSREWESRLLLPFLLMPRCRHQRMHHEVAQCTAPCQH